MIIWFFQLLYLLLGLFCVVKNITHSFSSLPIPCVLNICLYLWICLYQKKMVREAAFGNLSEWLRPPGEEVPSGTQGPFCPRFIFWLIAGDRVRCARDVFICILWLSLLVFVFLFVTEQKPIVLERSARLNLDPDKVTWETRLEGLIRLTGMTGLTNEILLLSLFWEAKSPLLKCQNVILGPRLVKILLKYYIGSSCPADGKE